MRNQSFWEFINIFYDSKKRLFEVIAFVGVISALFLQINQFGGDPLKMLQALSITFFSLLLIYLSINFWYWLVILTKETPKSVVLNGQIIAIAIAFFDYYLVKFLYVNFYFQLYEIFKYIRVGIIFIVWYYFSDLILQLKKKYNHKTFFTIIHEVIWIPVLYLIFPGFLFGNNNYSIFDAKYYVIPLSILLINLLRAFGWISKKTFYYCTLANLFFSIIFIYILIKYEQ